MSNNCIIYGLLINKVKVLLQKDMKSLDVFCSFFFCIV